MKKTFFNGNELQKEFQEYDRDYYSLDGYEALLTFYDEINEDMELDVIAICEDCTEYGNYSSYDFQDLIMIIYIQKKNIFPIMILTKKILTKMNIYQN